jgi:hypothetical protein
MFFQPVKFNLLKSSDPESNDAESDDVALIVALEANWGPVVQAHA